MSKRQRKSSKREFFQRMCDDYMRENGVGYVEPDEMARWAIKTGRWQERASSEETRCRREIVKYMRLEHFHDPDGHEVRKMHPVKVLRGDNYTFDWYPIYTMPPDKWKASQTLRRDGALSMLKQMKIDQVSWNKFNEFGATLPLFDPDFTDDLNEMDQPTDWPEEDPES